jgi:RNA polymerase sigma factor (sigma-70 family)
MDEPVEPDALDPVRASGADEGRDQERRLLERYRATRDPLVLGALFRLYQNGLYSILRRKTRDKTLAEDFLSQVWLQAYEAIDTFEFGDGGGDRPFRAWLRAIAKNAVNKWLGKGSTVREQMVAPADSVLSSVPDEAPSPFEELARKEQLHEQEKEAWRLLTSLEMSQRDVESIFLAHWFDLSSAEAAEIAGCSAGAMRVRTHRALRKLRQAERGKGMRP